MSTTQVTIDQGVLKGRVVTTANGCTYNSFRGVPYAKPPLGELRFQDPQPAEAWSGIYDATKEREMNSQLDLIFTQTYGGSEDSLHLNISVPKSESSGGSLPVMFWIHGGGFTLGSGGDIFYGPDYLVERNVIVVTFNYRLGPLGYLCLNTKDNPGNAGMKDQVMALKWVKNNIEKFGGDPENITIFGESAGGVSVHSHVVSPMSAGLFNKAIVQSGSCMNDWSMQMDPEKIAFMLAEKLGMKSTNKDDVLQFLKNVPVEDLVKISVHPDFTAVTSGIDLPFAPVIEKEHLAKESFLTQCPKKLMEAGKYNKVPTMIGLTSKEGILHYYKAVSTGLENPTLEKLIPDFQIFLTPDVQSSLGSVKSKEIAAKIKKFYFPTEDNLFEDYVDIMTDVEFAKDTNICVKLLSKYSPPTYYYNFAYNGALNAFKFFSKFKYTGAAHGDELGYLFKVSIPQSTETVLTETDIAVINTMSDMWTNFAIFGNPTPKLSENIDVIWKPATAEEMNCLVISDSNKLIQNSFCDRLQFWDDLLKNE